MTEWTTVRAAGVRRDRRVSKHFRSDGVKCERCASKIRNQNSGLSSQKSGILRSFRRRGVAEEEGREDEGDGRLALATAVAAAVTAEPINWVNHSGVNGLSGGWSAAPETLPATEIRSASSKGAVSYTHLTLPTILLV